MKLQAIKNVLNLGAIQRGDDPVAIIENDGKERGLTPEEIILVEAEVARLQAEAAANAYKALRAAEYPPIGDQLDALWKGGAEAEAMLAKVQAIKNKYPKGV